MSYRDPSLEGKDLTEREAAMLADHDAGVSNADLATKYGYASANGAGNVVRVALTKVGRGSAVGAHRGGGSVKSAKVTPASEMLRASMERVEATISTLRERVSNAESAAKAKPAEIIGAERERLETAAQRATDALATFEGMSDADRKAFVEKVRSNATTTLDNLAKSTAEEIERAEGERAKLAVAIEAIESMETASDDS